MGGGTTQLQRRLGRHRLDVSDTADTICSKDLFRLHDRVIERPTALFVNRKPSRALYELSPNTGLLWLHVRPIGIADKDALTIDTKEECWIFQGKLIETNGALDNAAPILVFTFDDVPPLVIRTAHRSEIESGDRTANSLVIAEFAERLDRIRQPHTFAISIPGDCPWNIRGGDFVRLHPRPEKRDVGWHVRRPNNLRFPCSEQR